MQLSTPQQLRTRRYYLHRRVRIVARLAVKPRTIYIPFSDIGGGNNKYVLELRERFGYVIQLEIP